MNLNCWFWILGKGHLVDKLIGKWVDTNKATTDGFSPIFIATLRGMKSLTLFKNCQLWILFVTFIILNKSGDGEIVEQLLRRQGNPNVAASDGETPLFAGISHKKVRWI